MDRKSKIVFFCLGLLCIILLITGGYFVLKELQESEYLFNIADDAEHFKVVFRLNGATNIDKNVVRCQIEGNSCKVKLPNATRDNGIVLGYSDNKDDRVAKYNVNTEIEINKSQNLYVISSKTNTLRIERNNVDYLEKDELSCQMFNEDRACKVILPKYNKVGFEIKGYSTSNESLTGFTYPNDEYALSKDGVLYPIFSTSSRHRSINVSKVLNYQESIIEIENGCSAARTKEYLGYLDDMSKYVPFLLLGNKITFVTDSSFDTIWGKTYVGMNFGPKSLRSVDIRCSDKIYNDYYATMVHEMAHSWDFYYANRLGENISSQSDIINLYNKYKNAKNHPFREYSYSNIYEFFADMVRYYYFKYYVPKSMFKDLSYPSDIKKVLEKYICIAKSNYDESKCK